MKSKQLVSALGLASLLFFSSSELQAQKKTIGQTRFQLNSSTPKSYVPFKVTDFAKSEADRNRIITLPNKKKMVLGTYVSAVNTLESRLSAIGFSKTRAQKTIVASRLAGLQATSQTSVPATLQTRTLNTGGTASASSISLKTNTLASAKFSGNRFILAKKQSSLLDGRTTIIQKMREAEIEKLPNEKFDRTHEFSPPAFKVGGYETRLVGKFYMKGENDPFVVPSGQNNNTSLPALMKKTTAFYTAGSEISASSVLPELGSLTVYKLEAEFTAHSNASKKHKSKTKLTVMQQVLINENKTAISSDSYTFKDNKLYNVTKLIGAADIFTYGINLIMPVDFYLNAIGIGADVDVTIDRTGISGTVGPRLAQSVMLETSATETMPIVGEGISQIADVGVGGELRLAEGGFDFGFAAGLQFSNGRLAFLNDMYAEANLEILRGRLFTFYQYPVFICDNIVFEFASPTCWEIRRVENELYNTGAALSFAKRFVDEDKTAYVSW